MQQWSAGTGGRVEEEIFILFLGTNFFFDKTINFSLMTWSKISVLPHQGWSYFSAFYWRAHIHLGTFFNMSQTGVPKLIAVFVGTSDIATVNVPLEAHLQLYLHFLFVWEIRRIKESEDIQLMWSSLYFLFKHNTLTKQRKTSTRIHLNELWVEMCTMN